MRIFQGVFIIIICMESNPAFLAEASDHEAGPEEAKKALED